MSDPIDDLLARLNSSPSSKAVPSQPPTHSPAQSSLPSDSIDHLLANLEGKADAAKPSTVSSSASSATPQHPVTPQGSTKTPLPLEDLGNPGTAPSHGGSTDRLLGDLRALYQEQDRAEELEKQQQIQAEQQRQATLKRRKQAAMARQAEEWLNKLNHQSSEAAWFEEFAAKYSSRVEAAIDYLGLRTE